MNFETSPKAIIILSNKNEWRTTCKAGSRLSVRHRAGDKKPDPALMKPMTWDGVEGGQTDKESITTRSDKPYR